MTYLTSIISFLAGAGLVVFLHRNMYKTLQHQLKNPLVHPKNSFDNTMVEFYQRNEGVDKINHRQKHDISTKNSLDELEQISKTYQPAFLEGGLLKLHDGSCFPLTKVITQIMNVTKDNYMALDRSSYLILELNKVYDELTNGRNEEIWAAFSREDLPEHMRPVSLVANAKHRLQLLNKEPEGVMIKTFRAHTKFPLEKELLQTAEFLQVNPSENHITTFGGNALWEKNKEYFYKIPLHI